MAAPRLNRQSFALGDYLAEVEALQSEWAASGNVRRLWERDASLWTGSDEAAWLGWLDVVARQRLALGTLRELQADVRDAGFEHAVVLGMGGSSLCPEVSTKTFGPQPGYPRLSVLDSTVPARVLGLTASLDLDRTLFIVASKSGTTAEPNAFETYFSDRVRDPRQFLAITDPGTALDRMARERGYRSVFHGEPAIGGRFSALSSFGTVPAAVMGLDPGALLDAAEIMVRACGADRKPADNPGVRLGLTLGALARAGRDKLTLLAAPEIESLGAWIEQLVAESTGKQGKGILPVDGEPLAGPDGYGDDRLFVRLSVGESAAPEAPPGHPSVSIALDGVRDLPQEYFRWEVATAVAGAVLGLNPFDQPDVEASKKATRALIARFEETGEAAGGEPAAPPTPETLRRLLYALRPGDYFAVLAYLPASEAHDEILQGLRARVLTERKVATTLGYGPRFLHSTGQLHKGGPDTGVFLQITAEAAPDVDIPGQSLTFGRLAAFQAAGDFQVLVERGRRAARVHLGADTVSGLRTLTSA